MVHEGDKYFERCYGADFAIHVAENAKEACWQAWIAHYTKFQPAHRVDYALGRIEALQNGEPAPALPGLMDAGLGDVTDGAVFDDGRDPSVVWLRSPPTVDGGSVPRGCMRYCGAQKEHCEGRCARENVACQASCAREREDCLAGCY